MIYSQFFVFYKFLRTVGKLDPIESECEAGIIGCKDVEFALESLGSGWSLGEAGELVGTSSETARRRSVGYIPRGGAVARRRIELYIAESGAMGRPWTSLRGRLSKR